MAENTINLRIEGMTCEGCAATISAYLRREEGVEKAEVSYGEKKARVDYDPDRTSPEKILRSRVFNNHYSAELAE